MKILSPIDRPDEVGPLADAGADELYGGYVSRVWRARYSMLGSANHRYFASAQLQGERELRATVKAAHGRGMPFYLALNAPYYQGNQYDDVVAEAGRAASLGVDALIVSDLGLILRLRDGMPGLPLHLSTLAAVFNSGSAAFFGGLGVRRMVFPRELTVPEMAGVVRANPGISFDAFIMVGKCPNIEGFCSFTHESPELIWPCEEAYGFSVAQGGESARRMIEAQKGWGRVNRRLACGLCAIGELGEAGVTTAKIVGRGGPTAVKVKVTAAVREAVDLSAKKPGRAALQKRARALYREVFGRNCNPYVCYFPD